MKLMKSALLGTAAALAATAGAQAADLPSTKSAPVEYVRVCDVYGAGFFYIPGTQTCLKIGGRVRFELETQSVGNFWRTPSVGGAYTSNAKLNGAGAVTTNLSGVNNFVNKNGIDSLGWLARGYLFVDARTQSAWGTVQTVMTLRVSSQSGVLGSNYTTGALASTNAFTPSLDAAYVRFAGFTFGRAASNFTPLPPYMYNTDYWGGFAAGIKQLAYTATFGGGFSASIALEDRQDMAQSITANALGMNSVLNPAIGNPAIPGGVNNLNGQLTSTAAGPSRLPNLVGNLRVDQAWGWAQLSGAVGQTTANVGSVISTLAAAANATGAIVPGPNSVLVTGANGPLLQRTGWALAGSVRINLPMIAAGDHLHLTAGYTRGMLDMIMGQGLNGNVPKNGIYMGGLQRSDRSMTIFCRTISVVGVPNGANDCTSAGAEQTKAWNVGGMFTHYWTPTVRQNFAASYVRVTPGRVAQTTDWQEGGLSRASAWTVGTNVTWSPVSNFDIGLELTYARLNQRLTGLNGAAPSALSNANNVDTNAGTNCANVGICATNFKVSPNVWNARIRVERSF